jgi:hypothetical protein
MNFQEIQTLVALVEFEDYTFHVRAGHGGWYLQATYEEPDIITGTPETQSTRRWPLSPEMVKSEVVQTAFKCVMTSMEHRAREGFKYRGRRVFGPHFDVDALWEIAGRLDYRGKKQ